MKKTFLKKSFDKPNFFSTFFYGEKNKLLEKIRKWYFVNRFFFFFFLLNPTVINLFFN